MKLSPEDKAILGLIDAEEYLALTSAADDRPPMSVEQKALLTERQLERWKKRKAQP